MKNDPEYKKRSVVIRTPDHHLRVFVSSTLNELAAERKAVHEAITKLRLAPVMFESGARPHPAQDLYQAYLTQSHIFIGIYWQNYGWIGPDMQVSGLEDEYNRSTALPRLIYIKQTSPLREPALAQLLERIKEENASSYKYFSTPDELRELVENDLILLLTEYFETAHAEEQPPEGLAPTALTNLPIPRNPLIGRELELETARSLLLRDDVALVTLTGPAGTGKSRLGIQIALDLRNEFKDGVYMVVLESIRDPGLVIPTIAKTLNITETASGLSLIDLLKRYLGNKQMLLLLDNFEQVLLAAPQVADLLETCPKVKILATSRASLHLRAEKELPIPPLRVPPLTEVPELQPLSQYSAVQLFIQRCQGVKADFQVTNENAPAIAEICHHLDGLPLAIELAAARIKLLPPKVLLSRLKRRFDVLRGGTKDLPERQQTMYSAIDWSYSLLNDDEKRLFQRLSVFNGGWTVEAAMAVCSDENQRQLEVFDALQMLVDNNLIRSPEEVRGEPRLKMLESIREFAYEHLIQSGEAEAIHDHYAQYYLALAERAETELYKSSQQIWHMRVDAELDNLRAVMGWAIDNKKREIALQITMAIWRFWWTHGYWSEGLRWLNAGLADSESISVVLKAKALSQSGWFYRNLGDFPRAITVLQESLVLWNQTDDHSGLAMALNNMGALVLRQGDIAGAMGYVEKALNLSKQQGDTVGTYVSLEILGLAASKQGYTKKAIELYSEALALAEAADDDDQIAKLLNNLGDEHVIEGNYDQAEECFSRAAVICKKHGNRIVGAYISGNRSIIAMKKGNNSMAFDLLVEAMVVVQESGDKEDTILCLEPFAYIARELGDPNRAARLFGASETLRKSNGMTRALPMQADYEMNITALSQQLGETALEAAWAEGSMMTLDQAVAYALQHNA